MSMASMWMTRLCRRQERRAAGWNEQQGVDMDDETVPAPISPCSGLERREDVDVDDEIVLRLSACGGERVGMMSRVSTRMTRPCRSLCRHRAGCNDEKGVDVNDETVPAPVTARGGWK